MMGNDYATRARFTPFEGELEQPLLQLFPRDLQMARDIVQDPRERPDLDRITLGALPSSK